MAVLVTGKVLLDTNVFVDYLRANLHSEWVFGSVSHTIRFLSTIVLMELRLGADTPRRERAVERILAAFPAGRLVAPAPRLYDHAGRLFRAIHGAGAGIDDRLGPMNDILIALSAREIGATVVTSNLKDFDRIGRQVAGLKVAAPALGGGSR
jgi:predicted nucleic acid-binding protein